MFEFKLENESGNIVDINDNINYIVIPPVSGLTPPSASLFTSKSPNRKGSKYNGSTLNERSIVITVKILGDVEENRNALYAWIDTEQYVKVYYRNGVKNVYCEGYVEECDIDLFTDNEVISLAIICPDPYWKDLRDISIDISELKKQFVFPFAIDSEGVPLSTISTLAENSIYYEGAETGIKIAAFFREETTDFAITDVKDATRTFKLKRTFEANELLIIDTESSPKTCKVVKTDGTTENALKYVEGKPTWFTLKKGYNYFSYSANPTIDNVDVTIAFTNKYLGV